MHRSVINCTIPAIPFCREGKQRNREIIVSRPRLLQLIFIRATQAAKSQVHLYWLYFDFIDLCGERLCIRVWSDLNLEGRGRRTAKKFFDFQFILKKLQTTTKNYCKKAAKKKTRQQTKDREDCKTFSNAKVIYLNIFPAIVWFSCIKFIFYQQCNAHYKIFKNNTI